VEFLVKRIANCPIDSNSFVIYHHGETSCVIVDPGTPDCAELLVYLQKNKLVPEYIILTHGHFDHIWGVNKLKDTFNCKIACTKDCAEKIVDKKRNLSIFYNQVGFEAYSADIIVNSESTIRWHNVTFQFIETPGHTDGCLCIFANNKIFTGDTMLNKLKTVVKLPGGSKKKLRNSLELIFKKFVGKTIEVYPGHGDMFILEENSFEYCYAKKNNV